jgi:hypothetical protein
MRIMLVEQKIEKSELDRLAKERFGDMVKAVVDITRSIMMVGGDLHSDAEALLLEQGSKQRDLWGINLYPGKSKEDWVEFDSMINLRPSQGNFSRSVNDPAARKKIIEVVELLVKEDV